MVREFQQMINRKDNITERNDGNKILKNEQNVVKKVWSILLYSRYETSAIFNIADFVISGWKKCEINL
jgi:hypothetical protein